MEFTIEKLIELFENNNDITFILSRDLAFDLVEELEMKGHRFCADMCLDVVKELYDSNVLIVSRNESFGKEECFFEVAYSYTHLKYIEEYQIAIIEEGVVEPWEIKEYVRGGYILFNFEDEYEEELDETDVFIEDVMNELLEDLNSLDGSISAQNLIKSYLLEAYNIGVKDGIVTSIERLEDKLKEQF